MLTGSLKGIGKAGQGLTTGTSWFGIFARWVRYLTGQSLRRSVQISNEAIRLRARQKIEPVKSLFNRPICLIQIAYAENPGADRLAG